jgi:hypothetical protein
MNTFMIVIVTFVLAVILTIGFISIVGTIVDSRYNLKRKKKDALCKEEPCDNCVCGRTLRNGKLF